jgi:hypothetical protein
MRITRLLVIRALVLLALATSVAASRPASAQIQCTNDTDCPGATCGSAVCQWTVAGHSCVPAGTDVQGYDGWCTVDSNCKCVGFGATCGASSHCTFTVSQNVDASTSGTTTGSSSGSSTSSSPGAAGCSMAPGSHGGGGWALAVAFAGLGLTPRMRRRRRRGLEGEGA